MSRQKGKSVKAQKKLAKELPPPSTMINKSIIIENVYPEINSGDFPVKRVVGDIFEVWADIFKPGHDTIRCALKYRIKGKDAWNESPMQYFENDRWMGHFLLENNARYEYTIEAWTDRFATLAKDIEKWASVGEDISVDLEDACQMAKKAMIVVGGEYDKARISSSLEQIRESEKNDDGVKAGRVLRSTIELISNYLPRTDTVRYKVLEVISDGKKAQFSAWYEMFHRSQGTDPGKSATFKDCEARLADIQMMGFDIIYLPPIHPIGRANRRGPNNSPSTGPNHPGSPWSIGSAEGGHMSVHPDLGTMNDFVHFVEAARGKGIEIALDLALQCSQEHPYVKEHPEWFCRRSDGSIRYAENPPKRYYDIYQLYFENKNWKELWEEMARIVFFWIGKGIKIFRVDNPHTKPAGFWLWLIETVKEKHPDIIFLSEAFTRPKVMRFLAKIGFTQSYTYFTWKNTKQELEEFIREFVLSNAPEYYRGNFFTNTPDILHEYLQKGGQPAFKTRLVLAATLSSLYGIYNGFELCENTSKEPGSEEYLDSEKYQYKVRDWNKEGNIKNFIAKINAIRRENSALHETRNLRLLQADNANIIFYGKWTKNKENIILVVVNVDPFNTRESTVFVPIHELGISPWENYVVHDLITDEKYHWKGEANYVKLNPNKETAHILLLER